MLRPRNWHSHLDRTKRFRLLGEIKVRSKFPSILSHEHFQSVLHHSRAKFGKKKNTRLLDSTADDDKGKDLPESSMFTGLKGDASEDRDQSSSSLLYKLLKRSRVASSSDEDIGHEESVGATGVLPEHDELLVDIRNFVAFQASVDGQATTDELLLGFKAKLPPKDSALFKSMLNQICTFHRDFGSEGIWRLKPEFR